MLACDIFLVSVALAVSIPAGSIPAGLDHPGASEPLEKANLTPFLIPPIFGVASEKSVQHYGPKRGPSKSSKEYSALKSDFENTHALITQTLASGSPVGNFDIENLRSKATECVFSCYLSRLDPFHQSELLTIADASFESIAHYLHQQSPNKYPPANDEEQQVLRGISAQLLGAKSEILHLLFSNSKRTEITVHTVENIKQSIFPLLQSLHDYYTELDPEYRRAVTLEHFLRELTSFAIQPSDAFRIPSGIPLLLARQSKWYLQELKESFVGALESSAFQKHRHSTLVAHLVKRVAYEVGLVSFFNVTNGKIASEMDVLLREVRDELSRFGIDTEFLCAVLMERMMARFQNVLTSVDHVLAQTTRDRLQDGVLPGQKGKRYLRLDTPLACYLLSFTGWVDEFVAWNTPNAQISDLIGLIKPKLTQLKTLGRVLPQQTFWDDY